jgi:hypothetical protein
MNLGTRTYLARSLVSVRASPPETPEATCQTIGSFGAALSALRAARAMDEDESRDWFSRLLVLCSIEPPPPSSEPGVIQFRHIPGYPKPPRVREVEQPGEFQRRVEGPDTVHAALGGELMVTGISVYLSGLRVDWSLSVGLDPPPQEFSAEVAATDQDTEGLPDHERRHLSEKVARSLLWKWMEKVQLRDDADTRYRRLRGDMRGTHSVEGSFEFEPRPPSAANVLTVQWDDRAFQIDLA